MNGRRLKRMTGNELEKLAQFWAISYFSLAIIFIYVSII